MRIPSDGKSQENAMKINRFLVLWTAYVMENHEVQEKGT